MIVRDGPCKGCEDRYVGCHGKCEKYQAYHSEIEQIRKTALLQSMITGVFIDSYRDKRDRLRKKDR